MFYYSQVIFICILEVFLIWGISNAFIVVWVFVMFLQVSKPLNRPGVWSCWTSRLGPCSDRRHGWVHGSPHGSCEPADGCCSDTRRSAAGETTHTLRLGSDQHHHGFRLMTHLRGGRIKPAADRPVAVLTGEVSVFINSTERRSNNITSATRSTRARDDVKVALTSRSSSWHPAGV